MKISKIISLSIAVFCLLQTSVAQDNMKGSWLPKTDQSVSSNPITTSVNSFLNSLGGSFRPLVCKYNDVVLSSSLVFNNGVVNDNKSLWRCEIYKQPVEGQLDALDLDFKFSLEKGNAASSGMAVAFDFSKWSADNYVLVPGMVYNANRFKSISAGYPPYIYDKKDKPLDMPITVNNIPRFNVDRSPAKIELLTGNAATPMMSFYDNKTKRGFIMLTLQDTRFGNSGMIMEENAAENKATFIISAPGVREKRYVMADFVKSDDVASCWNPGDSLNLKVRLYNFHADNLQQFFDKVVTIRKELSGETNYKHRIPFSALADIILTYHDKAKFSKNDEYEMIKKPGWVTVLTYPYIIAPTSQRLMRISKIYDQLLTLRGATGLLYGKYVDGKLLGDNYNESEKYPDIAMSYKNGESLYFGIQALSMLKQKGNGELIKPEWENLLQGIADGLVNIFKKYGQFGQFIDVETGEIDINGATPAACIIGLTTASQYFHNPEYLQVAEKAGDYYYNKYLIKGYAGGGANEILQSPGSSAPYELAVAYMNLYEITGKKEWLDWARNAANLVATWVVSYDYNFPGNSILHNVGAKSTGAIFASPQNNCATPGFYVNSGNFLLKLYRATNDKRYVELLKDVIHNVVQYTHTENNVLQPQKGKPGFVSERVQLSDWEGKESIGGEIWEGSSYTHWEVVTLLSILQNPGIYLRSDTGELVVFDHVDVQIIKRDKSGITLKISNPTSYDSEVSILSETKEQAAKPLGDYFFANLSAVKVKAGESVIYHAGIEMNTNR